MSAPQPKAKRRYNSWFVTVPLLVGTLAFALWFYRPTQAEIADMRAELELKQNALADAASLPLKLQQTNQELKETRAFVAAWRQAAGRQNLAAVFGELAGIVTASGAKAMKFEPEPAARCHYLKRVPLTLACEGTFPQVYRVLQQLEQMPQSIWIEDLHITHERKDAPIVTCVLKLAMFTGQSNPADKTD
jgi:Tfp pilus assembly protein PilO